MAYLRSITFPGIGKYDIEQEVPPGGSTGQVLKKKSAADGDVEWGSVAGAVSSVNGQSGDVVLDAEDVGARNATTPIGTSDLASGAVTDFHQISISTTTVWSSAGVVKVATISADWVSASDTIIFDIQPLHGEWADNIAQQEDWSKLVAVLIADGVLTFVATEAFQTLVYVGCLRVKR